MLRDILHTDDKIVSTSCYYRLYIILSFFCSESRFPASVIAPMDRPAPPLPEGLLEYLALLSQNGSLVPTFQPPLILTPQPPLVSTPQPPLSPAIPAPTQGRLFSRANRGIGGVLADKEKVSKQITAPATKRKSLVDPQVEAVSEVSETPNPRQKKRQRVTKVFKCI